MWNHTKNSMKKLKREISSTVLKKWKTIKTKSQITQNFQILYPIQGGYHVKAYVPRIPKMWCFLCLAVFKVELLTLKVRSNSKKNFAKKQCHKKITRAQKWKFFKILLREVSKYYLETSLRRISKNFHFWARVIFLWHCLFAVTHSLLPPSADFEQQ